MLTICKFGGSSVANEVCFKKIKEIVNDNPYRNVVVTSAVGKENSNDNKVTDLLYLLYAHIKYKVNYDNILKEIKSKFNNIKEKLNLSLDLDAEFEKILSNVESEDYLVSRGEYLTGLLLAEYLGYKFIDSKDLMVFNYDGKLNFAETFEKIASIYKEGDKIVIPGFYGAYPNGDIKLFKRGGSDITGSLVARALNADLYENFTDVNGFYVASPKIIDNPKLIKEITFEELRELSYMGANVIHEDAIQPLEGLNIPLKILNTNNPKIGGTLISNKSDNKDNIITGLAGKNNFVSINITKSRESSKSEVMAYVLEILNKYHINVESIPTSIDSFSVVVENKNNKKIYDVLSMIKQNDNIESISMDNDLSLLAIVGRNMVYKPGISAKVFSTLGKNNINVKLISQNTSEINIIVGIKNEDLENAIRVLYKELVA